MFLFQQSNDSKSLVSFLLLCLAVSLPTERSWFRRLESGSQNILFEAGKKFWPWWQIRCVFAPVLCTGNVRHQFILKSHTVVVNKSFTSVGRDTRMEAESPYVIFDWIVLTVLTKAQLSSDCSRLVPGFHIDQWESSTNTLCQNLMDSDFLPLPLWTLRANTQPATNQKDRVELRWPN